MNLSYTNIATWNLIIFNYMLFKQSMASMRFFLGLVGWCYLFVAFKTKNIDCLHLMPMFLSLDVLVGFHVEGTKCKSNLQDKIVHGLGE